MEPLYKIGGQVLIKEKYDPGCSGSSYRYCFVSDMLERFGGKVCTIKQVRKGYPTIPGCLPDDGYIYLLYEDDREYSWASSMFEPEF